MLKFLSKTQKISRAAIILAFAYGISYILGLFRDRTFVHYFGAGDELDAYNAAFIIPDFFFNLTIAGAITVAFIPVFTNYVSKKKEGAAWEVANSVLNLASILIVVICIICFFAAPWLIKIVAPGFPPEKLDLALNLTRILLLSPIIFNISNTFGSILVSLKKFTAYAFAPALYNLGIIGGTLLLYGRFGIYGAAIGTIVGALLHLTIQLIGVRQSGYKYKFSVNLFHPGIKRIIKLMIPKTLGLAAWQINLWVYTMLGSFLATGSIAIFNFSRNFQSLPIALIGISLGTAIFPTLAEKAALHKNKDFTMFFSKIFRQIIFLSLPATMGLILLRKEIIELILKTGRFTDSDVQIMSYAFLFFCFAITTENLVHLIARSFYAHQNTLTPVTISIMVIIVNIICSYYLSKVIGVAGLTLSFAIMSFLQVALLLMFLKWKIKKLDGINIFLSFLKISIATAVMSLGIIGIRWLIEDNFAIDRSLYLLVELIIITLASLAIYLIIAKLIRIKETRFLFSTFNFFNKTNRNR